MNLTIIKKLEDMYAEFEQIASVFNDAYTTAKVQTKEVDFTNEAGEDVQVSTKILFEELYHLGRESKAGKKLLELYPDLFAMEDKVQALRKEIQEYEVATFGFAGNSMRLIDFIHLIDKILQFRLNAPKEEGTAATPSMDVTE